jgi:outer membrane biosynthesis protein TonB
VKVNVDKTLVASIALHVLVIGYGLVTFSSRSMEAPPPDMIDVTTISANQLSQMTKGIKTGEKDKPKPKVEKVADAAPDEDAVGKVTEKKELIKTNSAPETPPQPVEKPVEKKPEPPKPVVENKPKEEPKPEKKPDQAKEDPTALLKKQPEAKKPTPKPQPKVAQAQPQPQPKPKQEYVFNPAQISANLDKRDPTRHELTGTALNASASLGTARGSAVTLSQSEIDAFRARVISLWNVPPNIDHPEEMVVTVRIQLGPDRRLTATPQVVSRGNSPRYQAAAEAAVRAVLQGQPYNMLRTETYEVWRDITIDFDPKAMFAG